MARSQWNLLLLALSTALPLSAAPDLSIDAIATPDPVQTGFPLVYSVAISNEGNSSATNVQGTVTLSENLAISQATLSTGDLSVSNQTVFITIPELLPGSSVSVNIETVPTGGKVAVFVGSLAGIEGEPIVYNNTHTFQTFIEGEPNAVPTLNLIAPMDNQKIAALEPLTITAEAMDPEAALAKVEYFMNELKVAELTSPPFNFTLPPLRPGTFTLTLVATDALGAHSSAQAHIEARHSATNKFINPRLSENGFSVLFAGEYLSNFSIQAADPGGPWHEIAQFNRTNLNAEIIDPEARSLEVRLYRAVLIEP